MNRMLWCGAVMFAMRGLGAQEAPSESPNEHAAIPQFRDHARDSVGARARAVLSGLASTLNARLVVYRDTLLGTPSWFEVAINEGNPPSNLVGSTPTDAVEKFLTTTRDVWPLGPRRSITCG